MLRGLDIHQLDFDVEEHTNEHEKPKLELNTLLIVDETFHLDLSLRYEIHDLQIEAVLSPDRNLRDLEGYLDLQIAVL